MRSYSPALAQATLRANIDDLSNYAEWQANSFLQAKESYLKANTVSPGESISGHILLPKKRLRPGAVATAIITLNGTSFFFKKNF